MSCKKRKLDKVGALMVIMKSQKQTQKNFNRNEKRYYFCKECNAYHTTSKLKK